MIDTQYAINQDSEQLSARARVKAFLGRADVMARMQAYGINPTETLSRVDSLTNCEMTSIADKMDRMPAGAGGTYTLDGSLLMFVGMALYAIIAAIVIYFSFDQDKEVQILSIITTVIAALKTDISNIPKDLATPKNL
jgi:hypothetical protein